MNKLIYLDNNSTTPLLPEVWEAMQPYWFDIPANPASSHSFGRRARQALDQARETIAQLVGAPSDEVIFTSGATEANNLAMYGLAGKPPAHLLLSPIEHPCITEPAKQLQQSGFDVEHIEVDGEGVLQVDSLQQKLRADTRLVATMLANHETGTIQPLAQIREVIPEHVYWHCDAAAAAGKIPIDFANLGVTSMTISGHKFHGPKGIGALVVRHKTKLNPLLQGGHQQQGKRPGTEPVALAVGMAKALELAMQEMTERTEKVKHLRQMFLQILEANANPVVINGPCDGGVPHTLNLSFPGCQGDLLLMNLDLQGIACSTGSACSSGSLLPSPVLIAMRRPDEVLNSAMRFSFSPLLSEEDIRMAATRIASVVQRLRSMTDE